MDRRPLLGRYKTILWILFYVPATGAGGLGDPRRLLTGLVLITLGAGGIKPCVSAFVGDQFRPTRRR